MRRRHRPVSAAGAPEIGSSTKEERRAYIEEHFRCISDCDLCGICAVYHNREPLSVYQDYIDGKRSFSDISAEYRR